MSEALPEVLQSIHRRAAADKKRICLPEVDDPRMVAARVILERDGLVDVVWVEDPAAHPRFDEAVGHILERRRRKGVDRDAATELARRPLFFAAALVALGEADGSVAGAANTTAEVLRAGLYSLGMAEGVRVVSSMFLMVREDTAYSYADCGVVPDPSAEELASIAATTARNHQLLTGEQPRVAFLSFSTKGSAEHPRVDKVRAAYQLFTQEHPDIPADGELQFDAAVVPAVAAKKAPGSPIRGNANVLVFPDLDAGNLAYKITQRLAGFEAFGPLTQGLAKPCLDLSRGCTAEDIVTVATIAAVMG